ncbi:MAG TPA: hypothetical protein VLK34_06065 [Nocardioidaceae bacterium]|nr:hypothetical protein [Nocardioidaceae bacterium]
MSTPPAPWTGTPFGDSQRPPQISGDDQESSPADQIVFAVASILGGVVAGFAGGAVWAAIADPPLALVTRQGVFLTSEISYDQRVTETLWFLAVGFLGGILLGGVIGLIGRRLGPATVVATVLAGGVASGLAAWSGINVFGPDLQSQLADASPGDHVHTALTITADVAYLGWPIGALIGLLAVTALMPNGAFKTPRRDPDIG